MQIDMEYKYTKTEERLFGLLDYLPNRAIEHKSTGAITSKQIKQPQDQEGPDNMKGGKK
jgi:hypothetical protein